MTDIVQTAPCWVYFFFGHGTIKKPGRKNAALLAIRESLWMPIDCCYEFESYFLTLD